MTLAGCHVPHASYDGTGASRDPPPPDHVMYDAGGISARCVVAHSTDPFCLLMLYEALDETGSHAICLASLEDDGATWARISQILRPSGDGWDSGAVSGPYLVPADPTDPTSRARRYYLGRSADGARQGIGVTESDGPEWRE